MPQLPTSCAGQLGNHIFISQTFRICLDLSVIFPVIFQTINLDRTLVLPPPLNQLAMQ